MKDQAVIDAVEKFKAAWAKVAEWEKANPDATLAEFERQVWNPALFAYYEVFQTTATTPAGVLAKLEAAKLKDGDKEELVNAVDAVMEDLKAMAAGETAGG